jgi:hypothetical protein
MEAYKHSTGYIDIITGEEKNCICYILTVTEAVEKLYWLNCYCYCGSKYVLVASLSQNRYLLHEQKKCNNA